MSNIYIDFRVRRCVHIAIYTDTHAALRKTLLERELSMQEMFQRFAELVVTGDKRVTKLLDELERDKRAGLTKRVKTQKLDQRGVKSIYDVIEQENQFVSDQEEEDDDIP